MYRLLAKMLCLSLIACTSATLMIKFASAQTIISGDIVGTVTDPTDAAVAGATVTLTSVESGTVGTTTTSTTGAFRFPRRL
jgi:Carboxypeptidase regulatory-like domain